MRNLNNVLYDSISGCAIALQNSLDSIIWAFSINESKSFKACTKCDFCESFLTAPCDDTEENNKRQWRVNPANIPDDILI